MLSELSAAKKAVGVKQTRRAVRDRLAVRVFLACDADPALTDPIADECEGAGIPVVRDYAMSQLGRACRIAVRASAVAELAE